MTAGGPLARLRPERDGEGGNAIIEFVFLGIMAMVPLVYLVVAVSTIQRNVYAVTQAAREAGRAFASTEAGEDPDARARYAMSLALADQHVPATTARLSYVAVGTSCGPSSGAPPTLAPGEEFAVCVTDTFTVPGVPSVLDAHRNTVTGRFVVHVDDYRATP